MLELPRASVVVPIYKSEATLPECLAAMRRQTYEHFELILIDSSPDGLCEAIVGEHGAGFRYIHSRERLLPHAARNLGVTLARSDRLVFTDPDVYPAPNWLSRLLDGTLSDEVRVGAVGCHGQRWLDLGVHFGKFDSWLPGGPARELDIAPTVNLSCSRAAFDAAGGIPGNLMLGDTLFSMQLRSQGCVIRFVPDALVYHHHRSTWSQFLGERAERGEEYGWLRTEQARWGRSRILLHLVVTLLPLRLGGLVLRTLRHAAEGRTLAFALATLPIHASGQAAWLAGEAKGLARRLAVSEG